MSVTLQDILFYLGALGILFLTPGPVWVALTARALSGGFGGAWPLAVGVALGDALWPLAAILGLSWIVSLYGDMLGLLRWVAVAVFVVMGAALIRHAGRALSADSRLTRPGRWAGFVAGVAVIVANPKAILFYMGVLPGFFNLAALTAADMAVIVCVSALLPMAGNLLIALFIDRVRQVLASPAARTRIDRIAGGLMIAVGVAIALF
jgi:threonine/homoserine/homoserine lactone efflux protein